MPRHPQVAAEIRATPGSIFSRLVERARGSGRRVLPLHIGDTYLEAPAGCRMQDLDCAAIDGLHRYAPVEGLSALLERVAGTVAQRQGVPTEAGDVLVTAGATGGLGAIFGAITEPGDEVLVPAPYWPLITGVIRGAHARPVAVDTLDVVDGSALVERLAAALTPRTVALYVNTPNNPTGKMLPASTLGALAAFARANDLWLVADEVYEDYAYAAPHVPLRPLAPERTFSVHSFSKAYGMAGNRCGFVVSPPELTAELRKISVHAFYATPTAAQHAALRAMSGPGERFVAEARATYLAAGAALAQTLGVASPEAGTFLFLELSGRALSATGILEACAGEGLLLAPGSGFGPYPDHARMCFTARPAAEIAAAGEILARHLSI